MNTTTNSPAAKVTYRIIRCNHYTEEPEEYVIGGLTYEMALKYKGTDEDLIIWKD